ncbi:Transferase [Macleaya cordata]|uniref:Transferase n=1 Tax=Macleaya cordata TaxID=56857 RepID=A0A200PPB1_MACCD|nr:Transferase [Macleaya cordata]
MKLEMKVEVVSRETIKPSSPTPHHLRFFKFSLLDQIAPSLHLPLLVFYPAASDAATDTHDTEWRRCSTLKKSLSEILTRYYPLAGRIKDDDDGSSNSIIDCNDDGVDYLEARVVGPQLSDIIGHPDLEVLNPFLPPCDKLYSSTQLPGGFNVNVVLAVQVNVFECRGMVIGLSISHKIADASSYITFINDWAAMARGAATDDEQIIKGPRFDDLRSLFPPKDDLKGFMSQSLIRTDEEIVTKKFVFGGSKIAELKKRSILNITNGSVHHEYPTRVQALSAFIWKRFMDVDQARKSAAAAAAAADTVYGAFVAINMRTRMVPPLPTNSIGNCVTATLAMINANKGEKDGYPDLVGKVREAIKKIDGDHVRKLQTTDALLNSVKLIGEGINSGDQLVLLTFTSWCKFPIYEADFGWGNPIWVSISTSPIKNMVCFMDTSSGDGIEAWVNMTKEEMADFERDEELLALVS